MLYILLIKNIYPLPIVTYIHVHHNNKLTTNILYIKYFAIFIELINAKEQLELFPFYCRNMLQAPNVIYFSPGQKLNTLYLIKRRREKLQEKEIRKWYTQILNHLIDNFALYNFKFNELKLKLHYITESAQGKVLILSTYENIEKMCYSKL